MKEHEQNIEILNIFQTNVNKILKFWSFLGKWANLKFWTKFEMLNFLWILWNYGKKTQKNRQKRKKERKKKQKPKDPVVETTIKTRFRNLLQGSKTRKNQLRKGEPYTEVAGARAAASRGPAHQETCFACLVAARSRFQAWYVRSTVDRWLVDHWLL